MPNYIEMIRLHESGFSIRQIAKLVGSGRNTVTSVIRTATKHQLTYQDLQQLDDAHVIRLFQTKQKPFQKKPGSRSQIFMDFEQTILNPLPQNSYELYEYKEAKVYSNSQITLNKYYYSVPYAYIGQTVTLKIYANRVAVYDKEKLLCTHPTE